MVYGAPPRLRRIFLSPRQAGARLRLGCRPWGWQPGIARRGDRAWTNGAPRRTVPVPIVPAMSQGNVPTLPHRCVYPIRKTLP